MTLLKYNNIPNNVKEYVINNYKDDELFLNQAFFEKKQRYIYFFRLLSRILRSNDNNVIIYTHDYQILSIAFILKKVFNSRSKIKFIYHEFELIEFNKLSKFSRLQYKIFQRFGNQIDLVIAPEINRLDYLIKKINIQNRVVAV